MPALQYRFNRNILKLLSSRYGEKSFSILLAVSGGVDSMTMAELAFACPYIGKLGVAHCNFSLRGAESDGDEALVRSWAEGKGLPLHNAVFDTLEYARKASVSVEMAARELRYAWFMELLDKHGYDYVAVAHNMNDNAETLFLNLLRGTGVRGISGMKGLSGRILRPMLIFSREEIEAFAASCPVLYRNDSTNFSSQYKRNRIRNEVFPILEKINPSFLRTLVSDMGYFSEVSDMADSCMAKLGNGPVTDISALEESGLPSYALFRIAERYGFSSAQCRDMEKAVYGGVSGNGKHFLSSSHFALIDRGRLLFYPLEQVPAQLGGKAFQSDILVSREDLNDGCFRTAFFSTEIALGIEPADGCNMNGRGLYLDAGRLAFPLRIRQWRVSDRMRPFGMKGWKKLSDIFTDAKMTLVQKFTVPVIEDASGAVVAITGMKSSEDFRVTGCTEEVLHVAMERL